MSTIYIVEDDENIREIVIYALKSVGFEARGFDGGAAFYDALKNKPPDLVLLDIMMPGDDGLIILRQLRNNARYKGLPVIMLTAKGSEYDKVKGLDAGADDYIAKPFGVMEIISRINAVLRRSGDRQAGNLTVGGIVLDDSRRAVTAGGVNTPLTYKEYELLHYLMINAGLVLSRQKLLEAVWGYDFEGESRTVDMHIKTLRQKLGPCGEFIKTVRNVGYRLEE